MLLSNINYFIIIFIAITDINQPNILPVHSIHLYMQTLMRYHCWHIRYDTNNLTIFKLSLIDADRNA